MRLRPEQVSNHLKSQERLASVYVVSGEEPLQVEDTLDQIRSVARAQGFDERQVLEADAKFDWSLLRLERDSLSLFAERRLIDLRLPSGKPGDSGGKALVAYAEDLPDSDTVLLLSTGSLDARSRRTKWYKTLEESGVAIHAWPISSEQLPSWIAERAQQRGFSITADATAELALRVEGNLLACAQELELLGMLCEGRPIDLGVINAAAGDNARFDSFDLVDATLGGDAARVVRVLRSLEREGITPTLVAGTLAWQIRAAAQFAIASATGQSLDHAIRSNPVWSRRKNKLLMALERHSLAFWRDALVLLRQIDKMSKGNADGNPWRTLLILCLEVAGLAFARGPSV